MMSFQPKKLKSEFVSAVRTLNKFAEIVLDEWPELHEPDFNFDDTKDLIVTPDSVFSLYVGAHSRPSLKVRELISLADELTQSKLIDNASYVAPSRAYVRLGTANEAANKLLYHIDHYGAKTSRRFETTCGQLTFALVNGFTPFAIHIFKGGYYDSDTYPAFDDADFFLEVRYPTGTAEDLWRPLIPAYLFELEQLTGIGFTPVPRLEDSWPDDYDEESSDAYLTSLDAVRLRPLMSGPGVASLLLLYERAIGREGDLEQHFVGFVKVMEYVSATVVNTERNGQIRRRLLSPRALSPDAAFIRDLSQLFESLRNFKKDAEALRLTIETCCDPVELAPYAPPRQRSLSAITEASPQPERKKALDSLSATFSATRNMFSHAKANYTLTGEECSMAELKQLSQCARIAAQQCIRWFAHSDVTLRIID
jgi:hypothetical protein